MRTFKFFKGYRPKRVYQIPGGRRINMVNEFNVGPTVIDDNYNHLNEEIDGRHIDDPHIDPDLLDVLFTNNEALQQSLRDLGIIISHRIIPRDGDEN